MPEFDQARAEEFGCRLFKLYTGGALSLMIDLGHRTGLFPAAAEGKATSEELAKRAGLNERYVREWLGAMVTGDIMEYDAAEATYRLPPEHAASLTGGGASDMSSRSQMIAHLGRYVDEVARAFREGGGVPYSAFRPEFTTLMDSLNRGMFDDLLIDSVLPLAPGLTERLAAGARVTDVGCGTGHSTVVMARAFPDSTFVGYDFSEEAIADARAEAQEHGLSNVHFEVCDVAHLSAEQPFDAVCTFDAIHDQVDPAAVLERIHAALAPGGTYLMLEPTVSSDLADNVGNPLTPWVYTVSTLHCMTVSLAEGGAGLGTAWGEQRARRMLADTGFGPVEVHRIPNDPVAAIFVTHRE